MARDAALVSFASAIAASAAVAACTLFVPIDDASGETPDAGTDSSTTAGADVNEGFDGSEPGCGARWGPEQSTIERVAQGHTGAACRICRAETSSVYMIINDQTWRPEPATGRVFRLDGWFRAARGSPEQAAVEVIYQQNGEAQPGFVRALVKPVPSTWTRADATVTVPDGATNLRLRVKASSPAFDSCVDVDDVSITRGR